MDVEWGVKRDGGGSSASWADGGIRFLYCDAYMHVMYAWGPNDRQFHATEDGHIDHC
jgi:hypothetical protein